jgi:hypothetical protein
MSQKPSVGRIIHVYSRYQKDVEPIGIGPYPAIVCKVMDDGSTILVQAFPTLKIALLPNDEIPYTDENGNEGRYLWWAWPERV